jgi:UDP-N-acetylmuramate--alanine ligase
MQTHYIKSIHFVGIGGSGMSGIAEILHHQGYTVQGSDICDNSNIQRLSQQGISITIGHAAANIRGAQTLVVSGAIPDNNPEILAARANCIPIITRGEMLSEVIRLKKAIAISGTHGKTTTTSIISAVLNEADLDPTIINGGIINTYQTNAILGNGEWIVVEADESDGSFLKLPSQINVVTNIDIEHMNYYKNEENLELAFRQFIKNIPFYGLGIICSDHTRVKKIFKQNIDRRLVTYGLEGEPNFKAVNIRSAANGTIFDIVITQNTYINQPLEQSNSQIIYDVFIPMFGHHNVSNSLATFAVSKELGINADVYKSALASFQGVKRRFTILGQKCGVTFVDDYAHHPVEIKAGIAAGKQTNAKRIVSVFQPHRYSRFSLLFNDFVDVLMLSDVVVVLPVYACGESKIVGYDNLTFLKAMQDKKYENVYIANNNDVARIIHTVTKEGDFCIGFGAGDITEIIANVYKYFQK